MRDSWAFWATFFAGGISCMLLGKLTSPNAVFSVACFLVVACSFRILVMDPRAVGRRDP